MTKAESRALTHNPNRPYTELPAAGPQYTKDEREVVDLAANKTSQVREELTLVTYQYWAPFNYPNITVELGREGSGAEFNVDGVELDIPPYGAITVIEEEPIVAVTVIGSACIPPGFVILHAEPLVWKYPRTGVKMKMDNLWGQHVTARLWRRGVDESWRQAGMSSAHFDVPPSRKVTIMGGSTLEPRGLGGPPGFDSHYDFRIIRITVIRKVPV